MKKYRTAAILMIIHGGLMEIGGFLFMMSALIFGFSNAGQYFEFKLQYFQDNLYMMSVMSLIFGTENYWRDWIAKKQNVGISIVSH